MAWMKELQNRFGKVTFAERTTRTATARGNPRTKVLAALRNSIALLENADFRVTRKGRTIEPERCFALHDDSAEVWVPYARKPLDLGGGKTAIAVPRDQLKATLEVLATAVEAGEFDAKIQQRRAAIRSRLSDNGDKPKEEK
jgi:hypothetical protein